MALSITTRAPLLSCSCDRCALLHLTGLRLASYCFAGILYTARPRGDITGSARFVDMRNRLCCEVEFGKQSGVEDRLLHRSDAISGSLFSFISEPKNASNGGLVSSCCSLRLL